MSQRGSPIPLIPSPMKEDDEETNIAAEPQADHEGVINLIEPTIVFKVQKTLFGLPRSEVMKSGFFRGMLESPYLGDSKEGPLENPIVLNGMTGIRPSDMKSLLAVINIRAYQKRVPILSQSQWSSAYRLAKMWEFDQLRDYIYKHIDKTVKDPLDRVEYADMLGLEDWIVPALAQLCRRDEPLTPQEGARLGIVRFSEVCKQRERNRSRYEVSDYAEKINKSLVLGHGE
ncbi:hypothetical protein FRB90_012168 [Tulasnella sp. 427]|nr:hypothetical protein FRB90_012168 [Tulasnella sp. 427]